MNVQMMRMIGISLLAGFVAGGLVWFAWGGLGVLRGVIEKSAAQRKLKADAAALLKQAEDATSKEKAK